MSSNMLEARPDVIDRDTSDARAKETSCDVSVGMTEGRGRGLFAARAMAEGATVLIERPLVAMQSLDNAQDVAVCRNCLGFVGDLILQLELLSGIPRHECLQRHEIRHQGDRPATTKPEGSGLLSGLHLCLQGCGEVYCSSECRAEHLKRCHRLLCVGPVPEEEAETHPLVAFRVHAMQTNEIFLLVGEVIAQTVAAAFPSHTSPGMGMDPAAAAAVDADLMTSARAPFADFVQEPWWDVTAPRAGSSLDRGIDEARAASLPETLRSLCEESSALLRRAFATLPQAVREELTAERFGRVVGMFEQNNVGVRVSSPVPSLLAGVIRRREGLCSASVDELAGLVGQIEEFQVDNESDCCDSEDEGEEGDSGKMALVPEQEEKSEGGGNIGVEEEKGGPTDSGSAPPACAGKGCCSKEEGLDSVHQGGDEIATLQRAATTERPDDMFAPLDGTALYSLVCCMNHSCRPNCVVRYPSGMVPLSTSTDSKALPLVAQVVLIEAVADGDELTQSYVDKEMGLLERRKALEDYGFLCSCPRCLEEETST